MTSVASSNSLRLKNSITGITKNPGGVLATGGLVAIAQAVDALRSKHERVAVKDRPVDLLVVVISVESVNYTQQPTFPSSDRKRFVRLGIQDQSLTASSQASIICRLNCNQPTIEIGDIVRFNRVSLKEIPQLNAQPVIYRFHHSSHDPENGKEYYRLGRIKNTGIFVPEKYDQILDAFSESFRVDQAYLDQLIAWYRKSPTFALVNGHTLSPLPCQYRTIRQLQRCAGAVSHVVATVTELHNHHQASTINKTRKWRMSTETAPTCFATLVDNMKDNVTLFVDSDHPRRLQFLSILQKSLQQKKPIRFARIQSKSDERDEIVLVPMIDTTLTFASDQEIDEYNSMSQRPSFSMTQQSIPSSDIKPVANDRSQYEDVDYRLSACIIDIILKNKSLRGEMDKKSHLKREDEWNSLFRSSSNSRSYCDDVVLVLERTRMNETDQRCYSPSSIRVRSDSKILQILCGDLELNEWQNVNTDSLITDQQKEYRSLVCDLIRGYFYEKIDLNWLVGKTKMNCDNVINVSLRKL